MSSESSEANLNAQVKVRDIFSLKDEFLDLAGQNQGIVPVTFSAYELDIDTESFYSPVIVDSLSQSANLSDPERTLLQSQQQKEAELQGMIDGNWTVVRELFTGLGETNSANGEVKTQLLETANKTLGSESDPQRRHQLMVIIEKLRDGDTIPGKGHFMFDLAEKTSARTEIKAFAVMWMLLEEQLAISKSSRIVGQADKLLTDIRDDYPFVMGIDDVIIADKFYDAKTGENVSFDAFVRIEPGKRRIPVCKTSMDKFMNDEDLESGGRALAQNVLHESVHLALDHTDDNIDVTEMLTQYATMKILYDTLPAKKSGFSGFIWTSNGYGRFAQLADCIASAGLLGMDSQAVLNYGVRQDDKGFASNLDSILSQSGDYSKLIDLIESRVLIGPKQYTELKAKSSLSLADLFSAMQDFVKQVSIGNAESPGSLYRSYVKQYQQKTGRMITIEEFANDQQKRQDYLRFVTSQT
jgi:hypothetical protein